jgi:hypothetical protein
MKRFEFRLERVRKWRQDQADIEDQRLEQLYAELRSIEEKRKEIESETDRRRRGVLAQATVMAEELAFIESFRAWADGQVRRLGERQRDTELKVQKQRLRVLEAHRRFQLLDGLKGKALLDWTSGRDQEQEELAAELYLAKRIRDSGIRSRAED